MKYFNAIHFKLYWMSFIMAFTSILMIHFAAHLNKWGTVTMEIMGPILGYYYIRCQVKETSDYEGFWLAIISGLGFGSGSGVAIDIITWLT